MTVARKIAYGALLVVTVPIVIALAVALAAFGSFVVAGLFTGLLFGALDFLGLLQWSDRTFLIVTIPVALVVAVVGVVFRDELSDW